MHWARRDGNWWQPRFVDNSSEMEYEKEWLTNIIKAMTLKGLRDAIYHCIFDQISCHMCNDLQFQTTKRRNPNHPICYIVDSQKAIMSPMSTQFCFMPQ